MRPLGHKEKNDLFFQFLVAFVLTAGLLLGALFLPQGDRNIVINDGEKNLFQEFSDFEKSKPALIKLIDTVQSEAKGIMNQNAGGNSANRASNDLINDFTASHNGSPLVKSISDLLSLYITRSSELKKNQDDIDNIKRKYEDCKGDLKNKKLIDGFKNQSAVPSTIP